MGLARESPEIPPPQRKDRAQGGDRVPGQAFYKVVCGWDGSYTPSDSPTPPL